MINTISYLDTRKDKMVDIDTVLTDDDVEALKSADEDLARQFTKSLEDLKKGHFERLA